MQVNDSHPGHNRATRWTARLALAGVSVIAAVVSYFHALAVVQGAGATPPVSYLVPFLADLVILGGSAALLDASRLSQPRPGLATVALAVGIMVTVAMNVAAGWADGLAGALVAGWPAVAFILALESLAGILRRGRGAPLPGVGGDAPATLGHCPHRVGGPADAIRVAVEHARECLDEKVVIRELARQTGIDHRKLSTLARPAAAQPPGTWPGQGGIPPSPLAPATLNGNAADG
jgi:hypothetical protein